MSNAEKEALQLTGYGDVPPWAVEQGLEQALGKGTYVPGEEALRLRLADALDLEERLATAAEDEAFVEGFQQGLVEGIEASQEAAATVDSDAAVEEHLAAEWPSLTLEAAATEEATTEGQEVAEEAPAGQWRSPLKIVTEGAEEAEQDAPGKGDAAPAAEAQRIEDRDFSSFTKTQLLAFAADHFGVKPKRACSKDELVLQVQRLVDEANEKAV